MIKGLLIVGLLLMGDLMAYEIKVVEPQRESLFYETMLFNIAREGAQKADVSPVTPFYLEVVDSNNHPIGGLAGYEFYGSLLIDILWVDPNHRRKGIGSTLLQKAEEWAQEKNLRFIMLSTMEFWSAQKFYEKNGFSLEYVREGFEKGFKQYHLIKKIKPKRL